MSLKNYIFASVNTKATSTLHNRHHHHHLTSASYPHQTRRHAESPESPDQSNANTMATILEELTQHPGAHTSTNWVKKVWKFVSVEPVMVCWILPSCLLYIAIENLALEKSCRVNFGYDDIVCDNMIDKSINNINCVDIRKSASYDNETILQQMHKTFAVINDTNNNEINITESLENLKIEVCHAEVDSQILDSALNVYTSPFDSVFGIIMILFAGGWSDKKGTRKPCMLLPLIGELLSLLVLLTASIFMKQLPLEFNSIGGKLFPAIFGGSNLMLMGVYSYLTEMTEEKDRTFRFGIFAVFVPLIPIVSVPFSGILFQKLRYIKLLLLCIPINIIGILYIIFVLKEVQPKEAPKTNEIGIDNLTFDASELEQKPRRLSRMHSRIEINAQQLKSNVQKNCLVQFFNPVVAIDCIRVILKKREYHARRVIILLLIMYFLATGPAFGEEPNEYNFTRIKLNWDGLKYSPFATYGNAISLVGTMLMVGGLSKMFHLSDPLVGFIGTIFSCVSRLFYATASTATMLYVARTIDMFISVRALTIKSVISTFVEKAELGRIFSIIGIIEAFGKFVFVSVYSIIYKNTLEGLPGSFYLCSFFCLVITAILFIVLYIIVRRKTKREGGKKTEEQNGNGTNTISTIGTPSATNGHDNPGFVSTIAEDTHV